MRYIILFLALFILSFSVSDVLLSSNNEVRYSPPAIDCRSDDDCTQCVDDRTIVYGQCDARVCTYAEPSPCPPLQNGVSARCTQEHSRAYCVSTPFP